MKKKDTENSINNNEDSIDLSELQKTIKNLQKEKDEIFAQLQRVSADYTNFQKRVPRQISDTINYEKEKIIKSLLPALDNFELTLHNAGKSENIEALTKGVQIIYDMMLDILRSHGVEQMKTSGQIFDPSMHEALLRKTENDKEDNIVLEEFQKGYKLNERVIRPSKVAVNKLPIELAVPEKKEEENNTDGDFETTDTEQ
jgi:molecular chaperone GrpE